MTSFFNLRTDTQESKPFHFPLYRSTPSFGTSALSSKFHVEVLSLSIPPTSDTANFVDLDACVQYL